ncbi:MAG: hypothetical protein ACRDLF_08500 [Solirubrobacteraceae bacterium]
MTATSRGRVAIAALVAALAFGAAFAVHKATAGAAHSPPLPTPIVLPSTPVHASGLALPAAALPALRRPPRPAPTQSTAPSPTPAAPAPAPAAPSTPAAPPSSGGKGSGPVLVG